MQPETSRRARRAYLCPIISEPNEFGGVSLDPKLPPLPQGTRVSCSIPAGEGGKPLYTHALVIVESDDLSAMDADADAVKLDTVPVDRSADALKTIMAGREAKGT